MSKLIVKGDDLGWTDGVNAGIEKAARDGILTAAGCMPNMPAAENGIHMLLKYAKVSIGQHTNIINGKPCSDPSLIPHLVEEDGTFHSSRYYRSLQRAGTADVIPYYEECMIEIRAQIRRFRELAGRNPAYLEGHSIVSDTFEKALEDAAHEEKIIYRKMKYRNCEDPVYHVYVPEGIGTLAASVFTDKDPYHQFFHDTASEIIRDDFHVLQHDISIVTFHPGFVDADLMKQSSFNGIRICDCAALCDERVQKWIKENHVELINYYDLEVKD